MLFGKPSATVVFPSVLDSMNPIEISDPATSLEAAFIQRYTIENLSTPWRREDLCGVYVLMSDLQFTNSFRVYVGSTSNGFEAEMQERNAHTRFWSNAILFANHDGENLTDVQAEGLAVRLHQLLTSGHHITVESEEFEPVDLTEADALFVDEMALFVVRTLFLKGYRSGSLARAVRPIEVAAEARGLA